jgi:hypothetical protein
MLYERGFEREYKNLTEIKTDVWNLDPNYKENVSIPVVSVLNNNPYSITPKIIKSNTYKGYGPTKNFGEELDSETWTNRGTRIKKEDIGKKTVGYSYLECGCIIINRKTLEINPCVARMAYICPELCKEGLIDLTEQIKQHNKSWIEYCKNRRSKTWKSILIKDITDCEI